MRLSGNDRRARDASGIRRIGFDQTDHFAPAKGLGQASQAEVTQEVLSTSWCLERCDQRQSPLHRVDVRDAVFVRDPTVAVPATE